MSHETTPALESRATGAELLAYLEDRINYVAEQPTIYAGASAPEQAMAGSGQPVAYIGGCFTPEEANMGHALAERLGELGLAPRDYLRVAAELAGDFGTGRAYPSGELFIGHYTHEPLGATMFRLTGRVEARYVSQYYLVAGRRYAEVREQLAEHFLALVQADFLPAFAPEFAAEVNRIAEEYRRRDAARERGKPLPLLPAAQRPGTLGGKLLHLLRIR